jgi:N-acetylglucosaminyl-diphospho-decaprenol L-rhamnosyltransferase
MIGSRIVGRTYSEEMQITGMRWRRMSASAQPVDEGAAAGLVPCPEKVQKELDAPSGVSIYVTRGCLLRIGLMDERYFLHFEDLEWGYRAKRSCGIGYAHKSVVIHEDARINGSGVQAAISELDVYLQFRNRVMFVRQHHPSWIVWTTFVLFFRSFEFSLAGAFSNTRAALLGLRAGVGGQVGLPDDFFDFEAGIPRRRLVSGTWPYRPSPRLKLLFLIAAAAIVTKIRTRLVKN